MLVGAPDLPFCAVPLVSAVLCHQQKTPSIYYLAIVLIIFKARAEINK